MDSFEINKIIAAVLLVALIIIGIGKISDIAFHVEKPKETAYKIEIPDSKSFLRKRVHSLNGRRATAKRAQFPIKCLHPLGKVIRFLLGGYRGQKK